MLDRFRAIRDALEIRIKGWLEHPEAEAAKLTADRERERRKRLEAAWRESVDHDACREEDEAAVETRELWTRPTHA